MPLPIGPATAFATHAFHERVRQRFDVAEAILFSSRARGDFHSDSDADVAVLLRGKPGSFLPTKLEMSDIAYGVLLDTGIRVQALPIWESEWSNPAGYSNPHLLANIEREAVRLRDRPTFSPRQNMRSLLPKPCWK
ncbi:MAG: nucleotidyltransferase domain-containing protein [Dechloromonas sp.]|uniref:Nucleotidyltransferase domain-containing protein n=1 Tax=Candidatus Dechloromonas phosphorivorans TaxID=2899244 RepID=A0A9D7LNR3_9RHOO|nr:nucleotidyltransferase domain-containing protein [Candidatus Dechloromonas phosphorivorans]